MALRLLSYNILDGGEDRLSLLAGVIQQQETSPGMVGLTQF
jgi:hypothetical protein